jgi:hypothetical protein
MENNVTIRLAEEDDIPLIQSLYEEVNFFG